jgi:hypothetical protein
MSIVMIYFQLSDVKLTNGYEFCNVLMCDQPCPSVHIEDF